MITDKDSFFSAFGVENFRILLERLPLATIVVDSQQKVIYLNPACERIYACRFAEVIHNSVSDMMFLSEPRTISEAVGTALGGKNVFGLEWNEEQYYEGRVFWRQGFFFPLPNIDGEINYAVLIIIDITEKVRSQNKVIRSLEHYRMLFESAPDPILIMRETQIVGANPAVGKILGFSSEELSGRCLWEISPELQENGLPSRDFGEETISRALMGEPQCFSWQFLSKDVKIVDTEVNLTMIGTAVTSSQPFLLQAVARKK